MSTYALNATSRYLDGAPHLKHADLRQLFQELVNKTLIGIAAPARVLDLGAGTGAATLLYLERGAHVVAVDDSQSQLAELARVAEKHRRRLEIVEADAAAAMGQLTPGFDVVVASSFIHHVPDYLSLLHSAVALLAQRTRVLTFQDPLLKSSLSWAARAFSTTAYAAWRIRQPDRFGGLSRRIRRSRGIWDDNCPEDVVEYHATRGGVDQQQVMRLLHDAQLDARLVPYFSTQSPVFHRLGKAIGLKNTFAVLAIRD